MHVVPKGTVRMGGLLLDSNPLWVTIWSRGRSIGELAHLDQPDGPVQGELMRRGIQGEPCVPGEVWVGGGVSCRLHRRSHGRFRRSEQRGRSLGRGVTRVGEMTQCDQKKDGAACVYRGTAARWHGGTVADTVVCAIVYSRILGSLLQEGHHDCIRLSQRAG